MRLNIVLDLAYIYKEPAKYLLNIKDSSWIKKIGYVISFMIWTLYLFCIYLTNDIPLRMVNMSLSYYM